LKDKTQEELNTIYLNKGSNAGVKKMAGRLIVENLFKDAFGVSLNAFENQNMKPEIPKCSKINLSVIEDIFMGKIPNTNNMEIGINRK
jgi:hypothetical protein